MSQKIRLPNIKPLWYQLPSWKARDQGVRFKLTSYPRRHGKDIEDLSMSCQDAVERRGSYYYVFPTRRWGERAIWETMAEINGQSKPIIDWIFPDEICTKFKSDLRIEVKGKHGVSKFFMGGTDNLDFVGQGGQGYTMSEFSLHKREVTSLLTPIIRQSQAYLRLNGTMRGKNNPLYEIWQNNVDNPNWIVRWLKPADTKLYCWCGPEYNINPELLPLVGKKDPATGDFYKNCQGVPYYNIQDDIDAGLISLTFARQEFLNEAISVVENSYYAVELDLMHGEGRYGDIDMTSEPVYTFWDLGVSDSTSITFAHYIDGKFKVIDYYNNSGKQIDHYAMVLNARNYRYGGHYAPHDLAQKKLFGDLITAAKQVGIDFRRVPKTNSTLEDIEIVRRKMKDVEISSRCEELFTDLEKYHENNNGKPCHNNACKICDGASHGADSFRTMIMAGHHNLITPYLRGGETYHLPDSVGEAEEYVDGFFGDDGKRPLWETFR